MIIVLASVVVAEGRLHEALRLSREHVARSRAEAGCIAHAVHVDAEEPDRLVFVEQWSDGDALKAHFDVPASRVFAQAMQALVARPPSLAIFDAAPVRP